MLSLTPAYDVCPQLRSGNVAAQAMAIGRNGFRAAQLAGCLDAADPVYLLSRTEARAIVEHQLDVIHAEWDDAADEAHLTSAERTQLWGRQFLNPFALENWS